jgi:hypothetical protein
MKLRFTIRDLLWLTLVVAMAVGWWMDHHNVVLERDQLLQKVAQYEKLDLYEGYAVRAFKDNRMTDGKALEYVIDKLQKEIGPPKSH